MTRDGEHDWHRDQEHNRERDHNTYLDTFEWKWKVLARKQNVLITTKKKGKKDTEKNPESQQNACPWHELSFCHCSLIQCDSYSFFSSQKVISVLFSVVLILMQSGWNIFCCSLICLFCMYSLWAPWFSTSATKACFTSHSQGGKIKRVQFKKKLCL